MKTDLIQNLTDNFEAHAQQTEGGVEFWLARDLQHLLGYAEWRNFNQSAVSKAKIACEVTGHQVYYHFVDVNKMVEIGSGTKRETTIFNSRDRGLASESAISHEHITNNQAVRKTMLERGIRPESLPPEEDIKKVERRLAAEEKKSLKNPGILE